MSLLMIEGTIEWEQFLRIVAEMNVIRRRRSRFRRSVDQTILSSVGFLDAMSTGNFQARLQFSNDSKRGCAFVHRGREVHLSESANVADP
jgi:hypothetical protein